jgi:hypothetical protein
MPPAEFEPAIPASERPQTHTLDPAATGIGISVSTLYKFTLTFLTCFYLGIIIICIYNIKYLHLRNLANAKGGRVERGGVGKPV